MPVYALTVYADIAAHADARRRHFRCRPDAGLPLLSAHYYSPFSTPPSHAQRRCSFACYHFPASECHYRSPECLLSYRFIVISLEFSHIAKHIRPNARCKRPQQRTMRTTDRKRFTRNTAKRSTNPTQTVRVRQDRCATASQTND